MQQVVNDSMHPSRSKFLTAIACLLMAFAAMFALHANAQQLTGTITGTAYDQSGAVVPKATVTLTNDASGDVRTATTDGAGHFAITSVQPANYSILISANGFSSWEEHGIVMNQGDSRDVPAIKLKIGGNATQVTVIGGGEAVVPTDTAEISTSLNEQMINDFPLEGRDAGELLKVMPGMGINVGQNGNNFDRIVGSNNGPVGNYSSNGTQPNGTMAFMLDGANLVDPGNFGTQIANINQDMVANVKVLMSNYGAEYAKGPVIFQAFSKSGGQKFHGEGYLYTHNAALNSVDSYTKSQGGTNQAQSYYYMGGNVGGPVLLPKVGFNKDRKKLFFWGGYEYMKQQPAGSIINYNVPNSAQLSGDFSNPGIPTGAINAWGQFYSPMNKNTPAGGTPTKLPLGDIDPNIAGILKLYPKTNQTPTANNGWNNYSYTNQEPQNRWEATGKLDYAFSDNTKLTGSYAYQHEADIAPISVWWSAPYTLPYPTPADSNTVTNVVLTNFTHVFNATTTNEFVFTWSHFVNPYALANKNLVSRKTNNFNVGGLFGHTTDQIPNFEGPWGGQIANLSNYPFTPGVFGGTKQVPAFYDNFTRLVGDHTLKVGFYWDTSHNAQNSNAPDNGTYNFDNGSQFSTGNVVADIFVGRINNYQQQNYSPLTDVKYHQWSIYAQDSWKAGRQLTLNYGLRFDHVGQWYGIPEGMQVWDPASYTAATNVNNPGLKWHAIDSSIPLSGFKSPLFYLAPRIGLAYDLFGTGKTVFRGGFAVYRYQLTSEIAEAGNGPLDSFEYQTPHSYEGYATTTTFVPYSSTAQNGSNIDAIQQHDSRSPFTNDWNATVSQALPWRSVVEISYVGNRSANEFMDGSNSNIFNINNVQPGHLYQKDPITNTYIAPGNPSCGSSGNYGSTSLYCVADPAAYNQTWSTQDFRPYRNYQNIELLSHLPYSNYNSLQASFQKQSGPVTFQTNYTFSKVLGIRDGGSNNGAGNGTGVDPFNIRNNYGPLAYDHTHIINATYNWRLPSLVHGEGLAMHLAGGAVNGWQLSGYTSFQSGVPLQPDLGGGFNAQYPNNLSVPTVAQPNVADNSYLLPNGLRTVSVSTSSWFGSNAYNVLIPALTCNPLKGLHNGMRFNPACFTTPAFGSQGPTIMPYMRTPNYFNSDLGIYKTFHVTEGETVQFRASANNFLNHPLAQFGLAGNADQQLSFINYVNGGQSLSPTNVNATTTGAPAFKTGSRFVTLAVKYYF